MRSRQTLRGFMPIIIATLILSSYLVCDAQSVIYRYDEMNRLIGVEYTENSVTTYLYYRYDDVGNRMLIDKSVGNPLTFAMSVNPTSHPFGSLNVGLISERLITVSNSGTGRFLLDKMAITGADDNNFVIQGDNCSNQVLAPSGTCTANVRFSPISPGDKTAKLSIRVHDPSIGTQNVPFTGSGELCSTTFSDIQGHWAENFIRTIACNSITVGCGGGNYCPENYVTRAQMAVFIILSMGETGSTAVFNAYFDDIADDDFDPFINRMYELGITGGCGASGARTYCPNDPVTREQMAVFMVSAVLRDTIFAYDASPYFLDVPSNHWAFKYIQKMYELGITGGCGGGNYCPTGYVTRAQMAIFLTSAFFPWTSVSAPVCQEQPVLMEGKAYTTLQSAYNDALPGVTTTIKARNVRFVEDLTVNRNATIILTGGYNCDFTSNAGNTTSIKGKITTTVGAATITIKNFVVEK